MTYNEMIKEEFKFFGLKDYELPKFEGSDIYDYCENRFEEIYQSYLNVPRWKIKRIKCDGKNKVSAYGISRRHKTLAMKILNTETMGIFIDYQNVDTSYKSYDEDVVTKFRVFYAANYPSMPDDERDWKAVSTQRASLTGSRYSRTFDIDWVRYFDDKLMVLEYIILQDNR